MSNAENQPGTGPRAEDLKEMLRYQDGAIVSCMLVRNTGGSVTLFAFDKGEGLSEHTAPFDALLIGVEGEAEVRIGAVTHVLREGQKLLIPANEAHALRPVSQFKMLLVMIRGESG